MKANYLIPVITAVLFLISCGESKTSNVNADSTAIVSNGNTIEDAPVPEPGADIDETPSPVITGDCYMKTSGRDTILLQLNISGTNVNGKMKYDNYQYDGSSGTIKGTIEGDILKLWYNFQAEGTNSIRQLYFKRSGDRLLFATGDQLNRGDSSLYKEPSKLSFSGSDFLRKWDCKEVDL